MSQSWTSDYLNIRIFSSRSAEAALSQPDSANTQLTIATQMQSTAAVQNQARGPPVIPKTSLYLIMTNVPGPNTPDASQGETKYL